MRARRAIGILFFMLVCLAGTTVCATPSLRIAYPEFTPFHYTDSAGEMKGFFYDILQEALEKRMGIPLVWTSYPWARCQENVKFGKVDAILTVPTPERAVYTKTHKTPFYEKTLHLFTYTAHPQLEKIKEIRNLRDIKTNRYSVITYSGNGWHKKNIESLGIKSYESSSLANVWQMLALKRGDIVIEWPPAAMPALKDLNLQELVLDTGVIFAAMPFHLLIRTESIHVNVLQKFDATLQLMKQDGSLSDILKRYH